MYTIDLHTLGYSCPTTHALYAHVASVWSLVAVDCVRLLYCVVMSSLNALEFAVGDISSQIVRIGSG